jgi:hypothetical protein
MRQLIAFVLSPITHAISPCHNVAGTWVSRGGGTGRATDTYRCPTCRATFTVAAS